MLPCRSLFTPTAAKSAKWTLTGCRPTLCVWLPCGDLVNQTPPARVKTRGMVSVNCLTTRWWSQPASQTWPTFNSAVGIPIRNQLACSLKWALRIVIITILWARRQYPGALVAYSFIWRAQIVLLSSGYTHYHLMWDPFGRFLNERERESYSPNSIPARIGVPMPGKWTWEPRQMSVLLIVNCYLIKTNNRYWRIS